MRPGWTLARMSPARYNSSIGRCMGFSFPKKAVFFYKVNMQRMLKAKKSFAKKTLLCDQEDEKVN